MQPLGHFKQSCSLLVKFEGFLIELTVENHSRLRRESKCLICTTKRVTGCQPPSITVLCDGRLWESLQLNCTKFATDSEENSSGPLNTAPPASSLFPGGWLSAQPTPWKTHPSLLSTHSHKTQSYRRESLNVKSWGHFSLELLDVYAPFCPLQAFLQILLRWYLQI